MIIYNFIGRLLRLLKIRLLMLILINLTDNEKDEFINHALTLKNQRNEKTL